MPAKSRDSSVILANIAGLRPLESMLSNRSVFIKQPERRPERTVREAQLATTTTRSEKQRKAKTPPALLLLASGL